MFIASVYNLKNKLSDSPILINNKPIPKIDHYSCLGVNLRSRETDLALPLPKKEFARGASVIMVHRIGTIFPMRQNLLNL